MAAQPPTIDIAMPIGHWSPHLVAALTSLVNQPDVFTLAIMDASDDPRVQEDIVASGLDVGYSRIGPDEGQAAAIAEGWANTSSDIVAWLNGDDMLIPGVLGDVAEFFAKHMDVDVYYGQSTISRDDGTILGLHPEVQAPSALLLRTNIISQPSCFIRRSALEDIGGLDVDLHFTMDWDLWIRLFEAGKVFHYTRQIFSNVTWYPDTKTSSASSARLKEIYRHLRKNNSLYVAMKGMFGLMVHHSRIYAFQRNKGLGDLNTPISKFKEFPILNVTDQWQVRLLLKIAKMDDRVVCHSEGADIRQEGNQFILQIDPPLAPGKVIGVTLEAGGNSHASLVTAEWQSQL